MWPYVAWASTLHKEDVELLLNASHGLTTESGSEVQDALGRVLQSPDMYLPLLLSASDPDKALIPDGRYRNRVGNAIAVIHRIGGARAEKALADRFAAFDALSKDKSVKGDGARNAMLLRNVILKALGEEGSDCLVEPVLAGLKSTDVSSFHVYMNYLQLVADKNAGVLERVRKAAAQAGRDTWPITVQTVEALQKAEGSSTTTKVIEEPRGAVPRPIAAPQPGAGGADSMPSEGERLDRRVAEPPATRRSWGVVAAWSAGIAAGVAILALIIVWYWRRK
jgi:hypothetical protein